MAHLLGWDEGAQGHQARVLGIAGSAQRHCHADHVAAWPPWPRVDARLSRLPVHQGVVHSAALVAVTGLDAQQPIAAVTIGQAGQAAGAGGHMGRVGCLCLQPAKPCSWDIMHSDRWHLLRTLRVLPPAQGQQRNDARQGRRWLVALLVIPGSSLRKDSCCHAGVCYLPLTSAAGAPAPCSGCPPPTCAAPWWSQARSCPRAGRVSRGAPSPAAPCCRQAQQRGAGI